METYHRLVSLGQLCLPNKVKMETNQSVLRAVQRDDWMVFIDLKDAYLQVLVHPGSRKYLRFVTFNKVFQFKVLHFSLFTTPQVFTRVMAPVSAMLHNLGVRILRYLYDWLILASSRVEDLWARVVVLDLCQELGILINFAKSRLSPSQTSTYLGMVLESQTLRAFPSQERLQTLLSQIEAKRRFLEKSARSSVLYVFWFQGVTSG